MLSSLSMLKGSLTEKQNEGEEEKHEETNSNNNEDAGDGAPDPVRNEGTTHNDAESIEVVPSFGGASNPHAKSAPPAITTSSINTPASAASDLESPTRKFPQDRRGSYFAAQIELARGAKQQAATTPTYPSVLPGGEEPRGRGRSRTAASALRESSFRPIDLEGTNLQAFQQYVGTDRLVQVNLRKYSYHVPVKMDAPSIKTVLNQSVFYAAFEFFRRVHLFCQREEKALQASAASPTWEPVSTSDVFLPFHQKAILKDITLCFEPGKTYLILAPPGGGKTTLLKAIAGLLHVDPNPHKKKKKAQPHQTGRIEFNGVSHEVRPTNEYGYSCRIGCEDTVSMEIRTYVFAISLTHVCFGFYCNIYTIRMNRI